MIIMHHDRLIFICFNSLGRNSRNHLTAFSTLITNHTEIYLYISFSDFSCFYFFHRNVGCSVEWNEEISNKEMKKFRFKWTGKYVQFRRKKTINEKSSHKTLHSCGGLNRETSTLINLFSSNNFTREKRYECSH